MNHHRVFGIEQIRIGCFKSYFGKAALLAGVVTMFAATGGCKTAPAPASEALATSAVSAQDPASPAAAPFTRKHIYSEITDPRADIAAAFKQAKREHKRVLLDFGGDWCGDCQVLDIYFHQSPNQELIQKNYVLVDVFIGQMDKNLEVASKYGVPIQRGVPALAVIDANGKVLYSQATGEFSNMRRMDAQSVTDFLTKWKA